MAYHKKAVALVALVLTVGEVTVILILVVAVYMTQFSIYNTESSIHES